MAANLIVNRTTTFFNDQDENGVYDPGDVLYTRVTITNNGDANATNVTFEDNFTGTTMVGGTLNISPIAFNDSFTAVANTVLRVGGAATIGTAESISVAGNLLTNDIGNITGDSVTGFQIDPVTDGVTADGGRFNIFADGSFNYVNDGTDTEANLADGDSFTYTIRDKGLDGTYNTADDLLSTATVKITFAEQSPGGPVHRVWYVDGTNGSDATGDGTSAKPYATTFALNGAGGAGDVDAAGHVIYVENNVTGSIELEASQKLIGTGADLDVAGFEIANASGNSTLTSSATGGYVVTVNANNVIAGLNIVGNGTNTGGITDNLSGSFGTLSINPSTLNAGNGSYASTISTTGAALHLSNGALAGNGFSSTTSTGGVSNVSLVFTTGTVNLGSGALSGATGVSVTSGNFVVSQGSVSVNYSGTITQSLMDVAAVNVSTGHSGTVNLSGNINATSGVGLQFTNADGTYNLTGVITLNGGEAGIDILQGSNGTFTFGTASNLATITHNNAGDAFVIDDLGAAANATVTFNGTITDNNGNAVFIDNHDAGTVTFQNGSINSTSSGIDVTNSNGGTINFNSQITLSTGANTGIILTDNNGSAINFNPTGTGLDISTTSGSGFLANNGGTITIADSGSGNTINVSGAAGGAVAFSAHSGTTFGSGGVTFDSISQSGGTNAIVLSGTGSSGGFTVTGTGSSVAAGSQGTISASLGTGGTIRNTTGDAISITSVGGGVTLKSMIIGDSTATSSQGFDTTNNIAGDGINIVSSSNIVLENVKIARTGGHGIEGTGVVNFTMRNTEVLNAGNAAAEDGLNFAGNNTNELSGTLIIADSVVTASHGNNLYISNHSGTLSGTVTNTRFGTISTVGNDSVNLETLGTAGMSMTFTNGVWTGAPGDLLGVNFQGSGGNNLTVTNGTFSNNSTAIATGGGGVSLFEGAASGTSTMTITGSTFRDAVGHAVLIVKSYAPGNVNNPSSVLSVNFTGNTIGVAGTANSGSLEGDGIKLQHAGGNGSLYADIVGNSIYQFNNFGINLQAGAGLTTGGLMSLEVEDNVVSNRGNNPAFAGSVFQGIMLNSGVTPGDNFNVYLQLDNNTATGSGVNGGTDFRLRQRQSTTVYLSADDATGVGGNAILYGGLPYDTAAVNAFVLTHNTGNTASSAVDVAGGGYQGAAPPQPMLATVAPAAASEDEEPEEKFADTPKVDNGETVEETDGVTNDQHGDPVPVDDDGGDSGPVVVDDGVLSQAELDLIVAEAIERWIEAGATPEQVAAMRATTITVADLAGLTLAESGAGTITLDVDAAGWRWFVDATPGDDGEYAGSGTVLTAVDPNGHAGTRIDLLTVIMHELGHQIGLSDTYATDERDELMHGTIGAGERRLPGDDDLHYAQDGPVSGAFAISPINLGTLEPGRVVTIEWRHTVDAPGEDRLAGYWRGQSFVEYSGGAVSPFIETSNAESAAIDSLAIGDLVFLDANKNGVFDSGTDSGIAGVTLSLYADTNNNGVYDDGTDLAIVFEDVNTNGTYEAGIDNPLPAGSTGANVVQLTATTGSTGLYAFTGLAPGDYIVRVDDANFLSGNALFGKVVSATVSDPDTDTDNGDNNAETAGGFTYTRAIRLDYGQEPTAGTGNDTNNTLDIGFEQPNQPPTFADLDGDNVNYTENAGFTQVDAGGNVDIGDPDSADFDGGSLKITVAGLIAGDEIRFNSNVQVDPDTGEVTVGGAVIGVLTVLADGWSIALDSDATHARIETLIRAVEYRNTTDTPSGTRTFTWTLVDGDGEGNGGDDDTTVTSTVTIVPVNDAPAGVDKFDVPINEDATYVFKYDPANSINDFGFNDLDGNAFAGVVIVTLPALGSIKLDGVDVTAGQFIAAADIEAGKLTYTPAANDSGNDYASFTFAVRDDGSNVSPNDNQDDTPNTFAFDVAAVNDGPVVDLNGAAGGTSATNGALEQDPAGTGSLAPDATVTDVDSADFDTGTLTVEITANAQTGDLVSVQNYTDGGGNTVTVSGNEISHNGTVVATFTAGDHDTPLVITFDADATPTIAQYVARAVYMAHTGDAPSSAVRTLTYTQTDGDGGSGSATATVSVTPDNDAPASTAPTNATISWTEDTAGVALMQGVVLSDPDLPATFLGGSLTITVSGGEGGINFKPGSLFSVSGGRLIYDDSGTPRDLGAISLIGTTSVTVSGLTAEATLARLNDLVDDFTFFIFGDNPTPGDRTVTMTFNDGNNTGSGADVALTTQETQTLTVTAVNDAPSVDLNGATSGINNAAAYTENASAQALAPDLVVADADDTMIESATVSIGTGFVAGADSLTIGALTSGTTGTGGAIAFSYNATTGVMTLTGSASKADYQAALRQVSFSSTSDNPGGSRSIGWTVNDGSLDSAAAATTLTITQVNDPPSSADRTVTTSEDDDLVFTTGHFKLNYADPENHDISGVLIDSLPDQGTLLLDGVAVQAGDFIPVQDIVDGKLIFRPDADEFASPYTSFGFRVRDTGGTANLGQDTDTATRTLTINVTPDNLNPTLALDDTGPSATLNYTEDQGATVIAPDAQVDDADSPNFDSGSLTVSFQANGEATDQLGIQNQGTGAGQIGFNGTSVSYGNTVFGSVTGGANGTDLVVTFNGHATPEAVQALVRAITYHSTSQDPSTAARTVNFLVTDGDGGSAQANAAVNVTQTNDAPTVTAADTTVSGTEDNDLVFSSANSNAITVGDVDGDTLTVTLTVANGTLTLSQTTGLSVTGDGTGTVELTGSAADINAALEGLVYRGNLNYEGSDTLGVTVDDGTTTDSESIAITLADDGRINGDSGDNVLNGTPQSDQFRLEQGGDDTANGLGSSDGFYFGAAFTAGDTVNGGGGIDVIMLQGDYSAGVTFGTGAASNIDSIEIISLLPGNLAFYGDTAGNSYSYNLTMLDANVDANDFLKVNGFHLRAGENLTFDGSAETDGYFVLLAGLGIDNLTGGGKGDVFFFGHDGRFGAGDTVDGGGGYDIVYMRGDYGIDFNDVGFAGSIDNVESIGLMSASDFSIAGGGDGEFDYAFVWNDAMLDPGERLTVNGSRLTALESMSFDGSAEASGHFRLWGGAATDTLTGGGGDDLLHGGGSADNLRGGGGADVFKYLDVSESGPGTFDVVQDFEHGTDKIDLQRIDAKSFSGGDQAFSFIGTAAFSGTGNSSAGQLRVEQIDSINNVWKVEGDIDGDGDADLLIQVTVEAGQPLTAGDFVL